MSTKQLIQTFVDLFNQANSYVGNTGTRITCLPVGRKEWIRFANGIELN